MAVKVIISGGGTGGHVFPAIAIADALKRIAPETEILFVGANGRMEMEKVPAAGYPIIGLDIQGINRQSFMKNIGLPFKLLKSFMKSRSIIKDFNPDVVVGVGGYASGPLLLAARKADIPYLIQEQNSYAGITNRWLGAKASKICVAFEGMERFFPQDRLLLTGNPVRADLVGTWKKRQDAIRYFGLNPDWATVLVTGGSLGALTLNTAIHCRLGELEDQMIQVIWQCGSAYYDSIGHINEKGVHIYPFLQRMDLAYAAADLIVSRAGAGTIAELCLTGKPVILVPSPNVAEDHQTKNAQTLVDKQAALLVSDADALGKLVPTIIDVIADEPWQFALGNRLGELAMRNADEAIALEVLKLAENKETIKRNNG